MCFSCSASIVIINESFEIVSRRLFRASHGGDNAAEERIERMHILIVEDEQRLARLVARVLGEERHVVDVANDGDTGLDLALRGTYDLLILDLMLPGHSGLDI